MTCQSLHYNKIANFYPWNAEKCMKNANISLRSNSSTKAEDEGTKYWRGTS